jgi:HAD superfamily hydrolase (TIGR01509 family)
MNVVFDFAGVVFHWQPLATLRAAIPQHAVDDASAEHWAAQIFTGWGGDWGEFDRGRLDAAALIARTAARTGLPADDVLAVVDAIPRALVPDAATIALIDDLRASGHRLLFLSNMPEPYARWLENAHPLGDWFHDGVFSSSVRAIKPEPAIYALAESRFGACGEQLVFLDDVVHNVRAAQTAGWRGLHYRSAAQAREGLAAMGIS